MSIGRKEWAIAEGYIPSGSFSEARNLTSHESFCVLNTGDADAHLEVLLFFSDRDPVGPYRLKVPSRRSVHFRFNDLKDPEPVPFDTPYASLIWSDVPVVVQHTRLDSRDPHISVFSTVAFS